MDTLGSPVLLRGYSFMETNNRTEGVSIGLARCCIDKTRHNRGQISAVPAVS
jgi:hypothetical protein